MASDFVGIFKIILAEVSSETAAHKVLTRLQDLLEDELEPDDEVTLTQLVEVPSFVEHATMKQIILLRAARNTLLTLKFNDCWNLAKQLDQMQFVLSKHLNPDDAVGLEYPHGHVMELFEEVKHGRNPLHH